MKVVIVNTSDIIGGAARAAYRLHKSLLASEINSLMIVQAKSSDDFTVIGPDTKKQKFQYKLNPYIDSMPVRLYKNRSKALFSPAWLSLSNVIQKINALQPDIVHLHWIASGFIQIEEIAKIKAPIVWSLHDMWPLTGGCHYDENCGSYTNSCGSCPVLGSKSKNDLSSRVLKRKLKSISQVENLHIVGMSRWLAECARKSRLFSSRAVYQLPNPIDTTVFSPFDKKSARDLLNLPQDKKLILFGAMGATSDPRKGFNELSRALMHVDQYNSELIIFGSSKPLMGPLFKQKTHYLGQMYDDVTLRLIYSAADVMIVPSLQENLSNTIMESLSCGTPVVAFDIGGNADMIKHMENGYLAKPFNVQDLAKGIDWVLQHELPRVISSNARNKVCQFFDSKFVALKYIEFYQEIINEKK